LEYQTQSPGISFRSNLRWRTDMPEEKEWYDYLEWSNGIKEVEPFGDEDKDEAYGDDEEDDDDDDYDDAPASVS
jgi:hypothetical protein